MKIILSGGRGYIGQHLARYYLLRGWEVVVLSRTPSTKAAGSYREVWWDGKQRGEWWNEIDGAQIVFNLTGRSVNCRYTQKNRQEIFSSRLDSTQAVADAIRNCVMPPPLWINMSTATIYRHAEDREMDENTGEMGEGFSIEVAKAWEEALDLANTPTTRKVALRCAMVMGSGNGGVFQAFDRLVRLGLGGTIGSGTQYVSWIHQRDLCRIVEEIWGHTELTGCVNACAPNPVTMKEFLQTLRRARQMPVGLPSARWMLEIGACLLGTETELLLKSRRVVPARLQASGFQFVFPHWESAARDIVGGSLKAPPESH